MILKKLALGLAVLSVLSCQQSLAVDWQYIAGADKTFVNLDFDSIATANGYRKAWIKINHSDEQKTNGYTSKAYRSQIVLYFFDCKARTLASTQSALYSKFNAQGEVVESRSGKFDPKNLDDVIPGSLGDTMLNVACGTQASRMKLKAKNQADEREFAKSLQQELDTNQNPSSSDPNT